MKTLTILIPAFNEEKTVEQLLNKIGNVELIDGMRKEIIFINDCSTDDTEGAVSRYIAAHPEAEIRCLSHEKNQGKGAAIRTGIRAATGDFIIIQDADLELDPQDYNRLLPLLLDGEKVVYGSRFLTKTNKHAYRSFYWGSLLVTTVANLLFDQRLTDEATCYKAFRTDFLRSLPLTCTGFEFCPEVTALSALRGCRIPEVPIHYYPRTVEEGKKIRWTDGVKALYVLTKHYTRDAVRRLARTCGKLSVTYLLLLACCFAAILGSYLLPRTEGMQRHLKSSLETLQEEGIEKRALVDMMLFNLDHTTNHRMLSNAAYYNPDAPLESALMNYAASNEEILSGDYTAAPVGAYGRYWHGYLTVLKPLLMVTDLNGIRVTGYTLLTLLLLVIVCRTRKQIGTAFAAAFIASLLAVEVYIVPLSPQLSTMFFVSLAAVALVLFFGEKMEEKRCTDLFFFVVGGLTSYFDFYTTPAMSLGLPLLFMLKLRGRSGDWRMVMKLSLCWAAGYAGIWMSKWIIASCLTDYDMIGDAFREFMFWMGGDSSEVPKTFNGLWQRIGDTLTTLPQHPFLLALMVALLLCGYLFHRLPKTKHACRSHAAYILVALIPIVWYMLTANPTGVHWRFMHRTLVVTIFAFLLFLHGAIDRQRLRKR